VVGAEVHSLVEKRVFFSHWDDIRGTIRMNSFDDILDRSAIIFKLFRAAQGCMSVYRKTFLGFDDGSECP
jgi:hypothetical protein